MSRKTSVGNKTHMRECVCVRGSPRGDRGNKKKESEREKR